MAEEKFWRDKSLQGGRLNLTFQRHLGVSTENKQHRDIVFQASEGLGSPGKVWHGNGVTLSAFPRAHTHVGHRKELTQGLQGAGGTGDRSSGTATLPPAQGHWGREVPTGCQAHREPSSCLGQAWREWFLCVCGNPPSRGC